MIKYGSMDLSLSKISSLESDEIVIDGIWSESEMKKVGELI